jgi:ERCC4-type nuclease
MQVFIDSHENFEEEDWIKTPLTEGDILIKGSESVLIERKTWDDAYTSWISKRLEDQVSRIIENSDAGILLVEGKLNQSWIWRNKKNYSRIQGLRKFLNRMSLEAIPVVFTDSKNDTVKYVKGLIKRIEEGDFRYLVRKTTVVKSSRNKYHNIMSLIPGITIQRSKALYNEFDSLKDFFINIEKAKNVDEKKRWHTQVNKIQTFINQPWGLTPEREVIIKKE